MTNQNRQIPVHIAIVMDGNGRWATKRLLPRTAGHREGVKATRRMIELCGQRDVKILTLFAFSSENWKRPKAEVSMLMQLFLSSLDAEIETLRENGVRLQFIGDVGAFSQALQEKIRYAEHATEHNDSFYLNIAVNYGGRWDISQACRSIAEQVSAGRLAVKDIDEQLIASHMALQQFPPPDLFIRTGGEQRISNFLLWQVTYTELYFTKVLWPDFGESELDRALKDYSQRQRRYGMTQEQVGSGNA